MVVRGVLLLSELTRARLPATAHRNPRPYSGSSATLWHRHSCLCGFSQLGNQNHTGRNVCTTKSSFLCAPRRFFAQRGADDRSLSSALPTGSPQKKTTVLHHSCLRRSRAVLLCDLPRKAQARPGFPKRLPDGLLQHGVAWFRAARIGEAVLFGERP